MNNRNPYFWRALQIEMKFCEGRREREIAASIIARDFSGDRAQTPIPCSCGGARWWKPTVGNYVCTNWPCDGRPTKKDESANPPGHGFTSTRFKPI